jgi:hypothetical protein
MKHNLFLIARMIMLSILITSTGCKKNKQGEDTTEQLPPETQTGAYTFGCKVDGIVYKASGPGGLLATQSINYDYFSDSTFVIRIASTSEKKFNMLIEFKCTNVNSNCLLSVSPYAATFYDNANGTIGNNTNVYSTTNTHTGNIVIKYFNGTIAPGNDGTIASGIFNMECINANGKVIKITEGRFDSGH